MVNQDCNNSRALAMELLQCYTKPSIWIVVKSRFMVIWSANQVTSLHKPRQHSWCDFTSLDHYFINKNNINYRHVSNIRRT